MATFDTNKTESMKVETQGKTRIIVETDGCIRAIDPKELAVCIAAKNYIK